MSADDPGLVLALRRLGATALTTLQDRLELASLELGEGAERLLRLLVAWVVVALLFGGAVVALSAWIAVALWGTLGPAVLLCLALAYAAAGWGVLRWLRTVQRDEAPLLVHTLAELAADAAQLRGQPEPGEPSEPSDRAARPDGAAAS